MLSRSRSAGPVMAEPVRSRVELGRGALRQPHPGQREPRVEVRQLLDGGILGRLGLEGVQRAGVVLLAVAHEADVVAEPVGIGALGEGLGQERLGLVVALLREIRDAEEIAHGEVGRRQLPRLLERLHGRLETLEGDVDEARVVESLHVVGVLRQGLAEVAERLFVALVLVGQDGLGHEDVGLGLLRPGRQRLEKAQKNQEDSKASVGGCLTHGLPFFTRNRQALAGNSLRPPI